MIDDDDDNINEISGNGNNDGKYKKGNEEMTFDDDKNSEVDKKEIKNNKK